MRYKVVVIGFVLLGLSIIMLIHLRKDMPYQFDFVRLSDGVAIINADSWNMRPLNVSVLHNGQRLATGTIDPESDSCVLRNIEPVGTAIIEISRVDLLGKIRFKKFQKEYDFNGQKQDYYVLVGASIGKAWNLPSLPERMELDGFAFGMRDLYQFDKTDGIIPLTKLKYKPRAVIIKQCSIYFPRDRQASEDMLKGWVEMLRENGIGVILATTTPVAKNEPIKGQQAAIDEWNRFIRDFGQDKKLPILDIAKALQAGWFDTHMKPGYYQEDGYHITTAAYDQVLDPLLIDFINQHFS